MQTFSSALRRCALRKCWRPACQAGRSYSHAERRRHEVRFSAALRQRTATLVEEIPNTAAAPAIAGGSRRCALPALLAHPRLRSANVMLRRAQHAALSEPEQTLVLARQLVAGKVQNTRSLLLRSARDSTNESDEAELRATALRLGVLLGQVREAADLDALRGLEGNAARAYFAAFARMVRADRRAFAPDGGSRRPPRDRVNALLSFCYALLRAECEAALEGWAWIRRSDISMHSDRADQRSHSTSWKNSELPSSTDWRSE